jgi:hypothetical protein
MGDGSRQPSVREAVAGSLPGPSTGTSRYPRHRLRFRRANLIERSHIVTGVDSSPELIEICRDHFPDGDWQVADMRTLAIGRHFDGVLAWDSFFHLCPDDQRGMFPIFAAHAAPHAALMFTSGPDQGEAIGEYQGEPLYHSSLDPDEYISLLSENGFEVVAHVSEDPTCGRHTIWLARRW